MLGRRPSGGGLLAAASKGRPAGRPACFRHGRADIGLYDIPKNRRSAHKSYIDVCVNCNNMHTR